MFIELTCGGAINITFINPKHITEMYWMPDKNKTLISFAIRDDTYTEVFETPQQIIELIKSNYLKK